MKWNAVMVIVFSLVLMALAIIGPMYDQFSVRLGIFLFGVGMAGLSFAFSELIGWRRAWRSVFRRNSQPQQ